MLHYDELDTPIGRLQLVADDEGRLVRVNLPESRKPRPRTEQMHRDRSRLAAMRTQFEDWFEGRRTDFDLRLHYQGTPFQHAVWDGLRRIEYGRTESYSQLAQRIGRARAVRAVGTANGANPLSIVVPCHRVIGADGSLTGYAGGIKAKRWLLEHEQRHA